MFGEAVLHFVTEIDSERFLITSQPMQLEVGETEQTPWNRLNKFQNEKLCE